MNENEIYCSYADKIDATKRAPENRAVKYDPPFWPVLIQSVVIPLALFFAICVIDRVYCRSESQDIVQVDKKHHDSNYADGGYETRENDNGRDCFAEYSCCVTNERCCTNKQGVGGE